jgi:hypothetical protein
MSIRSFGVRTRAHKRTHNAKTSPTRRPVQRSHPVDRHQIRARAKLQQGAYGRAVTPSRRAVQRGLADIVPDVDIVPAHNQPTDAPPLVAPRGAVQRRLCLASCAGAWFTHVQRSAPSRKSWS